MIMTTFPSFIIGLLIFGGISIFWRCRHLRCNGGRRIVEAIKNNFNHMSPLLLLPILVIIVTAVMKAPAAAGYCCRPLPVHFRGDFQGAGIVDCITMVHYGYSTETGNELADQLFEQRRNGFYVLDNQYRADRYWLRWDLQPDRCSGICSGRRDQKK